MTITLIQNGAIILEFLKGKLKQFSTDEVVKSASAKTHYMAIRIYSQTRHRMILKGLGKGVCH